ncbi:MAG TPA: hypothetical protein PLZ57_00380 [Pseudobdellovibrionaceae bacterium]|nr:hypothetical protein [Pseudobdellovibrionaceae bacterium]
MDRTPWSPDNSDLIVRVTRLTERLFACRLSLMSLEQFQVHAAEQGYHAQDLIFLSAQNFDAPRFIRSSVTGRVAFPLVPGGLNPNLNDQSLVASPLTHFPTLPTVYAVAQIDGLAASDDQRLALISDFLHFATESHREALRQTFSFESSSPTLKYDQSPSKVIRLFPRLEERANWFAVDEPRTDLPTLENKLGLDRPILFVCPPRFPVERAAVELFNRSRLWFFVSLGDLQTDALQSARSLRELGRMCIFVPDIGRLSLDQQRVFIEALSDPSDDGPRLIAGAPREVSELIESGALLAELADLCLQVEVNPTIRALGPDHGPVIRSLINSIEAAEVRRTQGSESEDLEGGRLIRLFKSFDTDEDNPTLH